MTRSPLLILLALGLLAPVSFAAEPAISRPRPPTVRRPRPQPPTPSPAPDPCMPFLPAERGGESRTLPYALGRDPFTGAETCNDELTVTTIHCCVSIGYTMNGTDPNPNAAQIQRRAESVWQHTAAVPSRTIEQRLYRTIQLGVACEGLIGAALQATAHKPGSCALDFGTPPVPRMTPRPTRGGVPAAR